MRRHITLVIFATFFLVACSSRAQPGAPLDASSTTISSPTTSSTVVKTLSCQNYQPSVTVGTITDPEMNELSGFAMSTRNNGIIWTHNDSGDSARIFGIRQSGGRAATVELRDTSVFDVEDIALDHATGEIWVADIGDNFTFRRDVQLYHFPEPELPSDASPVETLIDAKHIDVKYQRPGDAGTFAIDAESLFFDHAGNAYIVEKPRDQKLAWVFMISAVDLGRSSVTAQPIAQITGNRSGTGVGPTGADMSADGTTLAIKNYSETFLWRFDAESSIAGVLQKQPTAPCIVKAGLGEAITFDGSDLLTVEEGTNKPVRRTKSTN